MTIQRFFSYLLLALNLTFQSGCTIKTEIHTGNEAAPSQQSGSRVWSVGPELLTHVQSFSLTTKPIPKSVYVKRWDSPTLSSQPVKLVAKWGEMSSPDIELLRGSEIYGHFVSELAAEQDQALYPGETLSCLLWQQSTSVGEIFEIDPSLAAIPLEQLHHNVLTVLNMDASGAFGVLRAASEESYEVCFRLHAQFCVAEYIYLTPSQFDGVLVVDRVNGRILDFKLQVPQYHSKNLAFEVHEHDGLTGLGKIEELSIKSERESLPEQVWEQEISDGEARKRLADAFYTCRQIDWLPLKQAIKESNAAKKPLFLLAIAGVLDDQSC